MHQPLRIRRLARNRKGVSLGEYAFLIAAIALFSISVMFGVGTWVYNNYMTTADRLLGVIEDPDGLPRGGGTTIPPMPILMGSGGLIVSDPTTDISVPLHPGTRDGDLMVAFVMHRSTLDIPSGWEQEVSAQVGDGWTQWITVLSKLSAPGDGSSIDFHQSSPGRFNGVVFTVRGEDIEVQDPVTNAGENNGHKPAPAAISEEDFTLVLSGMTEVYGYSFDDLGQSGWVTVEPFDIWVMLTPDNILSNRLAVAAAWAPYAGETVPAAEFYITPNYDESYSWATVTVEIR